MERVKIVRNSARCLLCNTEIESTHVHDFVTCPCGNLSVDGGHDYLKRGVMIALIDGHETYTDTSVVNYYDDGKPDKLPDVIVEDGFLESLICKNEDKND